MNADDELVIPLSKTKILLSALGAMVFVVIGVWLIKVAGNGSEFSSLLVLVAGIGAVAFFGLAFLYASMKLFAYLPGLVINREGIVDHSSGVAAGLIPWVDITGISVTVVRSQRFLTIHVRNPERYLDRGNWLSRIANKANYKYYGSPVHISANSLQTDFDELLVVAEERFRQYGSV